MAVFGYDTRARKRAVNVSVNEDLIEKARALGVNVSALLEERLAQEVLLRQRSEAEKEAQRVCAVWNDYYARHGSPADEYLDL
jgi:antitoxin CcdA